MKTKTLNKKLVLSKSTIANISDGDMKEAYGGGFTNTPTECRTFCVSNCSSCITRLISDCIC
jgi:hypothetical protein